MVYRLVDPCSAANGMSLACVFPGSTKTRLTGLRRRTFLQWQTAKKFMLANKKHLRPKFFAFLRSGAGQGFAPEVRGYFILESSEICHLRHTRFSAVYPFPACSGLLHGLLFGLLVVDVGESRRARTRPRRRTHWVLYGGYG